MKSDALFFTQLGQRIATLRKKAGYTSQEAFAHVLGIHRNVYSRYEVGCNMELSTLLKITTYLKMDMAEFFSEGFN